MKLTVAICTRDRAPDLARALKSLCDMDVPPGADWELVVVDNGSSDNTQEVLSTFADRLPLRPITEPKAGLSNARNAAVAHAQGDYVFWIDDDVTAERGWLTAYWDAVHAFPDVAIFGGAIEPVLMPPTPRWFAECASEFWDLLAVREPRKYKPEMKLGGETPFGANFGIRTTELRTHIFDPNLGSAPLLRRSGEETSLISAVLREGNSGRWIQNARVLHWISASRQTLSYIAKYYEAAGNTATYLKDASGRLNAPQELLASALKASAQYSLYILSRLTCPPSIWIGHFKRYSRRSGIIVYIVSKALATLASRSERA